VEWKNNTGNEYLEELGGCFQMLNYLTNNKKLVHYIITVLLLFGFAYIPPMEPLTKTGMAMIGAFLGAVYGWSTIGMLFPSLLALVAMGLELGMSTILTASFGNQVTMMMVITLVVLGLLNETGATTVLASKLLTNKLTLGRPWVFMGVFLFAVFICASVNPILAVTLFIGFLRQICKALNIPVHSTFTAVFALGIALAAAVGQSAIPFMAAGMSFQVSYAGVSGEAIPYAKWLIYFIFGGILAIFTTVLVARFVIRLDMTKLKTLDPKIFGEQQKFSFEQKVPIAAFIIFICCCLLTSFLPETNPVIAWLGKLTAFGQIAIIAAVLMVMCKEDGKPFLEFGAVASRNILWDVVFMVALIMPLAQFLCAENTGVVPFLKIILQPFMGLPTMVFTIALLIIAMIVTNFANNFVSAILVMPIIYTYATQVGMDPLAPIMVLFLGVHVAIGSPSGCLPAGICYSFSDLVDAPTMMKYAWVIIAFTILTFLIIGYPVAMLLF